MAVADPRSELEGVGDVRTLVRRASERWGDKLALTFDESGEHLTFGDVERRANAIGNVLRGLGVEPGDKVAVMLPNRPEFPLGWLAITGIGATMVPINVFYKKGDAGYLLENSEARAILTADAFVPLITGIEGADGKLETVVSVDGSGGGKARDLRQLLERADDSTPPGRGTARAPRQHPIHLRHHRSAQGLHAIPLLLARVGAKRRRRQRHQR